jgi:hypothetical protein
MIILPFRAISAGRSSYCYTLLYPPFVKVIKGEVGNIDKGTRNKGEAQ